MNINSYKIEQSNKSRNENECKKIQNLWSFEKKNINKKFNKIANKYFKKYGQELENNKKVSTIDPSKTMVDKVYCEK